MKKLIALIAVILVVFSIATVSTTALSSPTAESYHLVNVRIKGTGGATTSEWKVPKGDTVTLTATEGEAPFVVWNIAPGDFELVTGKQTDKILTIRPLSDLSITAVFEDGLDEVAVPQGNESLTSPQTGETQNSDTSTTVSAVVWTFYLIMMGFFWATILLILTT